MILAVAMFAMATATFAADEKANATATAAACNMNVSMGSLADALSLNTDQVDAVADIHKNFTADLTNAVSAPSDEREDMVNKAIIKDLKYMHAVLNTKQYHKYVMLLNVTLSNRGLK